MAFIIFGNLDMELAPLRKALEEMRTELDAQKDAGQMIDDLRKQLAMANERIDKCNQTISNLEKQVKELKQKDNVHSSMVANVSSTVKQEVREVVSEPVNNTQGPIKRYFSSCGMSGFEVSYMLSNPSVINGQGYYEVTDRGNDTGSYQPNVNLGPTLLMNASNMLEPFFDIHHDDSGELHVISPGEVKRQGKSWQIVKKCVVAY